MKPKTEIAHITTPVAKYTLDFNTGVIKAKPIITNADRIRTMPDEELALFIHNFEAQAADIGSADTVESWLDWLKQDYITFVAQEYKKDLNDRLNREGIFP